MQPWLFPMDDSIFRRMGAIYIRNRSCGMCVQDLEAVCREAAKQAADWAASVRSTSELADDTGYELCSGHSRSLVAVIAEKRDCARRVLLSSFPTHP